MAHRVYRSGVLVVLVVVTLLAVLAPPAQAAPLRNWKQVLHQPDGTVVNCLVSGDEYFNYWHDESGYLIIRDDQGWLTWAVKVGDEIRPSANIVGRTDPKTLALTPWLRPGDSVLQKKWERFNKPGLVRMMGAEPAPPFTSMNNIVLFVCFSDEEYSIFTHSAAQYDGLYNVTTAGASSMKAYFKEASYNQLTLSSAIPASSGGGVMVWRTGQPRAYYQPYNSGANPTGYQSDAESAQREHLLLKEVVDGYVAAGLIPTSLNVDTNNDGYVDNVTFIISGETDGWNDLIWPHRWFMSSGYPVTATINGKTVDAYNFNLDAVTWKTDPRAAGGGVGTLCHEMTHTLGAPDLYHYKDAYSSLSPVGGWDIMEQTTDPPQHSDAYLKLHYMKWISSIPSITSSGTYTLNPLTSSTNNAYKIASPNSSTEYFIVEYRRKTGTFEGGIPGSGLLVYRINSLVNDGSGNAQGPPDEVYLYRPGGSTTVDGTVSNANLSSDVGRTMINDMTDPDSFLSNGAPGGLNISSVGSAGGTISFHVTIGGSGACTYVLTPSSASAAATGGSGSVQVATQSGCAWTASSGALSWLGVTNASGSGSGSFSWSASSNSSSSSRSGSISVGGQTFTVTQSGTGSGGAYTYWVEVGAHNPGSGGSQWATDLGVLNIGGAAASITVQIMTGTNPSGTATVNALNQKIFPDIAGQIGITNASGALKVTSNQPLMVSSRTYNDQGTNGTFGQFYDGYVSGDLLSAGMTVILVQLSESSKYRTNIAVTNTGSSGSSVRITLYSATGAQLNQFTLSPNAGQRIQDPQPFKNRGGQTSMAAGYAKVEILSGSGIIVSASVIDNKTGDPTTIPPK